MSLFFRLSRFCSFVIREASHTSLLVDVVDSGDMMGPKFLNSSMAVFLEVPPVFWVGWGPGEGS